MYRCGFLAVSLVASTAWALSAQEILIPNSAGSENQDWQQWPDFCYTTNGRNQVISVTCGSHYDQKVQCGWSPGGGRRIWMHSNQTSYIAFDNQYSEEERANSYFAQDLLGGSIQFDFDTKQQSCGCIGQVSLLAMPAINEDGTLNKSDSHFGCDARGVTGALCPEITLFEGNQYGFRVTPRTCDEPSETGYYSKCDADGNDGVDVNDQTEFTYGPGADFDINSLQTVTFKVDFHADGDVLTGYSVTLTQGDKSFTVDKSGDYLAALSKYLKQGMVIQISQRDGDAEEVAAITHGTCSGACATRNQFKWGNLVTESLDKVYPPSEPNYSDYVWEAAPWDTHMCANYGAGECQYSWRCIQCAGSYPKDDPAGWDSKEENCRCHDWTPYPYPIEEKIYCPYY